MAAGLTLVLSIIYLILLRWIAKPMLYISLVLTFLLLVGGGLYVYFEGYNYYSGDHTRAVMTGMAILIWILAFLYLVLILCCFSRIQLAAAIMDAASDFVRSTARIFWVPFVFYLVICVWIVWWVFNAVWVFSVGTLEKRNGSPIGQIQWDNTTRYVWIYQFVGLLWITAFINACS